MFGVGYISNDPAKRGRGRRGDRRRQVVPGRDKVVLLNAPF